MDQEAPRYRNNAEDMAATKATAEDKEQAGRQSKTLAEHDKASLVSPTVVRLRVWAKK